MVPGRSCHRTLNSEISGRGDGSSATSGAAQSQNNRTFNAVFIKCIPPVPVYSNTLAEECNLGSMLHLSPHGCVHNRSLAVAGTSQSFSLGMKTGTGTATHRGLV
jgi:hypothetical protein